MAKRAGSEETPKVGAKSPGAARQDDNQVVTQESYLSAVREIAEAEGKVKAANEIRKSVRKRWKGSGIELGVLDAMVKMAEWSRGEIRDHFSIQAQYAEWLGLPVGPKPATQADIFKGMDDDEIQRREWFALGTTYSRTGKPGRPPEECPEEFHQAFMAGFNEEDEAAWLDADQPDKKEAAPEPAVQPKWAGFSNDPDDWFAAQWRDFNAWFETVPSGFEVKIMHAGVAQAFTDRVTGARDANGDRTDQKGEDADPLPGEAAADEGAAKTPVH